MKFDEKYFDWNICFFSAKLPNEVRLPKQSGRRLRSPKDRGIRAKRDKWTPGIRRDPRDGKTGPKDDEIAQDAAMRRPGRDDAKPPTKTIHVAGPEVALREPNVEVS